MSAAVLAVGMVSALGLDWETSCAASRCAISRAATLDHYRIQAGDPWEVEFVVGHQVDLLTRGFEGKGRLVRLLAGALEDLLRKSPSAIHQSASIPVYLALPDPHRTLSNVELILDEERREEVRLRRAELPPSISPDLGPTLLANAAVLAAWPGDLRLTAVCYSAHTGMIEILDRCLRDRVSGSPYVIVGAVDSLLDDETLAWLHGTRRLKNPALATGIIPGEAAVLFLLKFAHTGTTQLGNFESVALERDDQPFESCKAPLGRGLSNVVRDISAGADWPRNEPPWLLSDHNGENYAASDWGWALQRLTASNPSFSNTVTWFPATSFGDTGVACAAVAAACALAGWRRSYAPSSHCCITASADDARRAALLMAAPLRHEVYYHGRSPT